MIANSYLSSGDKFAVVSCYIDLLDAFDMLMDNSNDMTRPTEA